jgi:hypothetical protein
MFLLLLILNYIDCSNSFRKRKLLNKKSKEQPVNTKTNGFSNGARSDNTVNQWMKDLRGGEIKINRLSIPGSHDTCSKDFTGFLSSHANTQSWTILDQLNAGIRYFDIRLNENTQCIHGQFVSHIFLKDILKDVKEFLRTSPDEAIIMRLQFENNGILFSSMRTFSPLFDELLTTYKDLFNRTDTIPKLKDVRGKIWPIFEIANREYNGFNWKVNHEANTLMVVQDDYYFYTDQIEKNIKAIRIILQSVVKIKLNCILITFLHQELWEEALKQIPKKLLLYQIKSL